MVTERRKKIATLTTEEDKLRDMKKDYKNSLKIPNWKRSII